jgi:hypothetical protein
MSCSLKDIDFGSITHLQQFSENTEKHGTFLTQKEESLCG